ncbi:hypothetical protein [Burkholderia sp. Ac-20365]|jgi:hypothetical protein|uniref:hypothetical protein n=1 Tax=Burkholderia sp. Ac-20365 TaxID=2703897 RepID=UPI00197B7074|nr:hypothetical protein [Burkholderia sp. Ac-20365]MBN3763564.1 hypothetical protein [Burkholderia sp. Ac-20365]
MAGCDIVAAGAVCGSAFPEGCCDVCEYARPAADDNTTAASNEEKRTFISAPLSILQFDNRLLGIQIELQEFYSGLRDEACNTPPRTMPRTEPWFQINE